jgi:hypothetical protein
LDGSVNGHGETVPVALSKNLPTGELKLGKSSRRKLGSKDRKKSPKDLKQ